MNKSFSQLKTNVGNRVQDTSTDFATLIGYWINDKYRDAISKYDWDELYFTQSINASANTSAYALSEDAERILSCVDTTNDLLIEQVTNQQFYLENYDILDDTGTPDTFFLTYDVVKSQPASAEQLTVKSSSASDTTQTVLIRGIVSGAEIYESVTLTGTTAATATNSYTRILGISKSATTAGYVTVYENDGSTTLAVLPAEQLESSYQIINLFPIPSGAITYNLRLKRRVLPLAQDYDYPIVKDIADSLEYGAAAEAWRYKRQDRKAQVMDILYEKGLSEKVYQRVAQPGMVQQMTATPLDRDDGIL